MPRFGSLVEMKAGLTVATTSVSSNTTLTAGNNVVLASAASGNITITLPTAAGATGRCYTIARTDSTANTVTVATTSSQTIDGATTFTGLIAPNSHVTVVSDGSNWQTISYYTDPPRARISRSTNQSIGSGSNTTLTLATNDWGTTPSMLSGTTILLANVPGMYKVSALVSWASGVTGFYQTRIMRAGASGTTEAAESTNVGSTGVGALNGCSTIVNVTAAQLGGTSAQFSVNCFQNTGSSVNVTAAYLEMIYMGPAL